MTTKPSSRLRRQLLAAALALLGLHAAPAVADGRKHAARGPLLPSYQQECASCHLAYPPGMLPASAWQRLMDGLPRHFGTDASLEPALAREIGDWLQAQAAGGRASRKDAAAPAEDRITRSAWFLREHRELRAETWARPSIQRESNCAACHPRADQGDFDEHRVRIPR